MKQKTARGARLGQHFLTAPWALAAIKDAAALSPGETVLEIGPGSGNLTSVLLECGAHVIAVEKDASLIPALKERFSVAIERGVLELVHDDIRSTTPEKLGLARASYALVANIPYYITGDIMRTFLSSSAHPSRMVLLVQKEVAERVARAKKESVLSVSVKVFGIPRYVRTVPKGCFSPPPSVDSAILSVRDISREVFTTIPEASFFSLVKRAFLGKRKMVGSTLKEVVSQESLARAGIRPTQRPEEISVPQWLALAATEKNPSS